MEWSVSIAMAHSMLSLIDAPAFKASTHFLSTKDRARLSYERAKLIGLAFDLSIDDIAELRPAFWKCHSDPIVALDGAATTILTIQYNLVLGTLSHHLKQRPDLSSLVDDLLKFRKLGQFMLTELSHGIDAYNIETTATLLQTGEFLLHTPRPQAAKFMPPTIPVGTPCVAVVFARLIVNNAFHGIRPFIVDLNNGTNMCSGVSARLLPPRGGSNPVNHSLTYFNRVRLPSNALLGLMDQSDDHQSNFSHVIWRVAVGSLALATTGLSGAKMCCAIGARYSARRTVTDRKGQQVPIIQFRTQQIPILTAISQVYVNEAFSRWAIARFCDTSLEDRVRHGVAACAKATIIRHSQTGTIAISDRCGAQGLFEANDMYRLFNETRGISIAEGDILALSIRLTIELLLGRYELPASTNPTSLLARYERSTFEELQSLIVGFSGHRAEAVNRQILPRCQSFVEAIGHRMAYDAAVEAGVMPCLIDLYVANAIKHDPVWYAEEAGIGGRAQRDMEESALDAVLPHMESLVEQMGVNAYIRTPIVSEETWDGFVDGLPLYRGRPAVEKGLEREASLGRATARL